MTDHVEQYQALDLTRYNTAMRHIWPWPSILIEEVASRLKQIPGKHWLDAACGEGQLADLSGMEKQLVGLDLDRQRLLRARKRPYQATVQGSVTSLPFADASFDGIATIETLEHIPDIDTALKEFARCLKDGGYLLVTVPSVTLRSLWQMMQLGIPVYCDSREHVREFSPVPIHGFPHRFKTWAWLETTASRQGFHLVRQGGVGYLFPMCTRKLAWLEHAMNLLYRERINRIFGRVPVIRYFCYYLICLFRLGTARE